MKISTANRNPVKGLMPLRFLPDVAKEWREPRHENFAPRTLWSLHNAFTEVQKQMPISTRFAASQDLGRLFVDRAWHGQK